jgi:hypothetical protein
MFERWQPETGLEFDRFVSGKPADMQLRLRDESLDVLSHCVKPGTHASSDSQRAGLVLGLVQSGKTSSFTAVTALARDNAYNLVIVIAGTTTILQDQTYERLKKDLGLSDYAALTRWTLLKNPSPTNDSGLALAAKILQHTESSPEDAFDLAVPLVVVMKQHLHLNNLNALLKSLDGMNGISALVVDDEAHMHSPNIADAGDESATYARIRTLRSHLPIHTFLQYTATPQANLLAHIADELSPEFIYMLEPGNGYAGGEYFFVRHHSSFSKPIGPGELYALEPEEFQRLGPPASLRRAFISFLLSCAIGRHNKDPLPTHNTMLVHPHSTNALQALWHQSILAMRDSIRRCLLEDESDPDRKQLLSTEFQEAWEDLSKTCEEMPPLDDLIQPIVYVLSDLQTRLVNAKSRGEIPWMNSRYWVIVGGNLLGVGFTVEGLRTTHMMRSVGVGLADTIQQRGRFFGYKASYGAMCRAWLQQEVDEAFVDYVTHERELRRSLQGFVNSDRPLQEWKRVFFLDPRFKPTRKAAWKITMDGFKPDAHGWILQSWLSTEPEELSLLRENWSPLADLLGGKFHDAKEISGATLNSTHGISTSSLTDIQNALTGMSFPGGDAAKFSALQLLLAKIAEDGHVDKCSVVSIANQASRRRTPTVAGSPTDGRIVLHQGRSPGDDPNYLGDTNARLEDQITLQIHNVSITREGQGESVEGADSLPFVALYLPPGLRANVLVEA